MGKINFSLLKKKIEEQLQEVDGEEPLLPEGTSLYDLEVKASPCLTSRDFICQHHYSGGCHNRPITFGLYYGDELIGVVAYANPCSENVRRSVAGEEYKNNVIELHRLAIKPLDNRPRNLGSWFVSRSLDLLKNRTSKSGETYKFVISFADSTEGHLGYIYQSLNFIYCGVSESSGWTYRDEEGRLRHARQNGVNISSSEANKRGWKKEDREVKYRYILPLYRDKREKKELLDALSQKQSDNFNLPYPKGDSNV